MAAAFRKADAEFEKEDYKAGAKSLETAYAINPEDDLIINLMVESNAMVGDLSASLMWMRRLLAVSPCFFHLPENDGALLSSKEFLKSKEYREIARAAQAREKSMHRSELAFMLSETDLIPEGIAYDPLDRAFFLSSLHKRKVVRVRLRARGASPLVEDFTASGQDGLYSTLGMKVDAERRVLWVCSSAEGFMRGYSEADAGKAALFKYDLKTRKLIRKYEVTGPRHLLNDIAVNKAGDVFVTDTATGEIFSVRRERDELEVFIPAGRFSAPNGIAISDDGRTLFISDMPWGVYVFDLQTGHSERLPQSVGISPSGSDGLYFYDNSLIGIINIVSEHNGRVARFYLDSSAKAVSRAAVLDCNNRLYQWPTTGVVVGNSFFYIANSQYGSFDGKQRTFPLKQLHKVAVMKLKL
jgi:sugar lactone lactonase YvrE